MSKSPAVGRKLRVSVVGSGYWGRNLVRNFHALDALESVCDVNEETLTRVRNEFQVATTKDYEAILGDSAIDAVVLATPAAQHYKMASAALMSGKHDFVEKPLAGRSGEKPRIGADGRAHPGISPGDRRAQPVGAARPPGQDSVHLFFAFESGETAHRGKYPVELRAARHFGNSANAGRNAGAGHGPGWQLSKSGNRGHHPEHPRFHQRCESAHFRELASSFQGAETLRDRQRQDGGIR